MAGQIPIGAIQSAASAPVQGAGAGVSPLGGQVGQGGQGGNSEIKQLLHGKSKGERHQIFEQAKQLRSQNQGMTEDQAIQEILGGDASGSTSASGTPGSSPQQGAGVAANTAYGAQVNPSSSSGPS